MRNYENDYESDEFKDIWDILEEHDPQDMFPDAWEEEWEFINGRREGGEEE